MGWLSRLESRTKPILIPLLLGQNLPITLSSAEQDLLGVWAYKTALMVDFILHGTTTREYRPIPRNAYRRFYKSQAPLSTGIRVWTIPIANPQTGIFMERTEFSLYHESVPVGKKTIPRTKMNAYLITFTIHHAAFQVCGPLGGPAVLRFRRPNPDLFLQLFPRTSDEGRWPYDGRTCLMWDDLQAFARRTGFLPR